MSNRSVRSGKKTFKKSFTYFIPTPPQRKNGYREREFDKIVQGILGLGFDIESLHTAADAGGMFVLMILKTNSKKTYEKDINQDLHEGFKLSDSHTSADFILDEDEDV